jgi:hypothetical protein
MARPLAHAIERPQSILAAARSREGGRAPAHANIAGLRFALPRPTLADLHVLDASGRRVRTLACGELAAGEHDCGWDGRDDAGNACGAGTYVLRLETNGSLLTSRIVAIR